MRRALHIKCNLELYSEASGDPGLLSGRHDYALSFTLGAVSGQPGARETSKGASASTPVRHK